MSFNSPLSHNQNQYELTQVQVCHMFVLSIEGVHKHLPLECLNVMGFDLCVF